MPTPEIRPAFSQAVQAYRRHTGLFLGLTVLGNGLNVLQQSWYGWRQSVTGTLVVPPRGLGGLLLVTYAGLSMWTVLASYVAAQCVFEGGTVSLGSALGAVRGKFWRFIGITLIYMLIVGAGTVLLILPGIYWGMIFSLYGIVIALEPPHQDAGPLSRSRALVKGAFWKTLGLYVAMFLLYLPGTIATILSRKSFKEPVRWWWLQELALLTWAALQPLAILTSVAWYRTLKARSTAAPPAPPA